MAEHSTLTGSELHENKGAASASNDTVATATAGATVWKKLTTANLDSTSFFGTNQFVFQTRFADVSSPDSSLIVFPFACTVNKIVVTLSAAITVADSIVTSKNHSGGSMGTITVAYTGSAAKSVFSLSPVSNNVFGANEVFSIETDGGSTTTSALSISVLVTRTG